MTTAQLFSNGSLAHALFMPPENVDNGCILKGGLGGFFPVEMTMSLPALSDFIGDVIPVAAQKKVANIDAGGVIAGMAQDETPGNVTVGEHPDKAMHQVRPAVAASDAIAAIIPAPLPFQAACGCPDGLGLQPLE